MTFSKRKRIAIAVSIVVLITLIGTAIMSLVPEPEYKGRRLGAFLETKHQPGGEDLLLKGIEAVKSIGPPAVPYLQNILKEPTAPQRFWEEIYVRTPVSLQSQLPAPLNFNDRRARAAALLWWASLPEATAAVPSLIRIARQDPFFGARHNAIGALARLGPASAHAEEAIDAIIKGMNDPNAEIRQHSYGCLGGFTNHLDKVVPVLLAGLRTKQNREASLSSLSKLGTNVMSAVRRHVTVEGYLPMSFEALEEELANQRSREH